MVLTMSGGTWSSGALRGLPEQGRNPTEVVEGAGPGWQDGTGEGASLLHFAGTAFAEGYSALWLLLYFLKVII